MLTEIFDTNKRPNLKIVHLRSIFRLLVSDKNIKLWRSGVVGHRWIVGIFNLL